MNQVMIIIVVKIQLQKFRKMMMMLTMHNSLVGWLLLFKKKTNNWCSRFKNWRMKVIQILKFLIM